MGEGGVKNPETLPTSFIDDPFQKLIRFLLQSSIIKSDNEIKIWNGTGRLDYVKAIDFSDLS